MSQPSWDIKRLIGHLELVSTYVGEQVHEPFRDLCQRDSAAAIEQFAQFLDQGLSAGHGLFRGQMCGGPHESVTAPLLDSLGMIYPALPRAWRQRAFRRCLGLLDELTYPLAQTNVERINEPWLIRDIIMNRWLYWSGYNSYSRRLAGLTNWEGFREKFAETGSCRLLCLSHFWLGFAVSRREITHPAVQAGFLEHYQPLAERVQDAIAGLIHFQALAGALQDPAMTYQTRLEEKITHYAAAWGDAIRTKVGEARWILLPETLARYQPNES